MSSNHRARHESASHSKNVLGLANLSVTKENLRTFITKHDQAKDLADLRLPVQIEEKHGLIDVERRLLFLRDLIQSLWTDRPEESAVSEAEEILFTAVKKPGHELIRKFVCVKWARQALEYCPETEFQAIVYYLLRHSHLAKICQNEQCPARFFFAKKANERYCSNACFTTARRKAKSEWWNAHGENWRRERT